MSLIPIPTHKDIIQAIGDLKNRTPRISPRLQYILSPFAYNMVMKTCDPSEDIVMDQNIQEAAEKLAAVTHEDVNKIADSLKNLTEKTDKASKAIQDLANANLRRATDADNNAQKILRERKPGEEISIKDIQKIYGKNWKKALGCIPLPDQVAPRDKKKAKASRKARRKNRKK